MSLQNWWPIPTHCSHSVQGASMWKMWSVVPQRHCGSTNIPGAWLSGFIQSCQANRKSTQAQTCSEKSGRWTRQDNTHNWPETGCQSEPQEKGRPENLDLVPQRVWNLALGCIFQSFSVHFRISLLKEVCAKFKKKVEGNYNLRCNPILKPIIA